MSKGKKILKITGITILSLILVIIIALITIPYLFKDDIIKKAKEAANENLNAIVEFKDISLSLFRNFPSLTVGLEELVIVGVGDFKKDTLVSLKKLRTCVNVGQALSGKIEITKVLLESPRINLLKLDSLRSNFDIVKKKDEKLKEEEKASEPSSMAIKINDFKINNASIKYEDRAAKMLASLSGLNLFVSGDFEKDVTNLIIKLAINNVNYQKNEKTLVNSVKFGFESSIKADLKNKKYTISKNLLQLNELKLHLNGNVDMGDTSKIKTDIVFKADETSFKTLLSFIPAMYNESFKKINTQGNMALNVYIKGDYKGKNYPAFGLNLSISNAMFKYSDLPKSVDNINVDLNVVKPQGDLNLTTVDLNTFHMELAKNPVDANLNIKTPISNANMKGKVNCDINLASLKDVLPLKDMTIDGNIKTNILFNGNYSDIEKKLYEKFNLVGLVELNNFTFANSSLPDAVKISSAKLAMTPISVKLINFNGTIGKSDFSLKGELKNYLAYYFKKEEIRGELALSSNYFDLNPLMKGKSEKKEEKKADTTGGVIIIPSNVFVNFTINIKELMYDKMPITNIEGLIKVEKRAAVLDLNLNMLDGSMGIKGLYSTKDTNNPNVDFGLKIKDFNMKKCYTELSIVKEMLPIAKNVEGKIGLDFVFQSFLDKKMKPVTKTINGKGAISSSGLLIEGADVTEKIASALKNNKFKRLEIGAFKGDFDINNGNLIVKPFVITIAGNKATISGIQNIDKTMEYKIFMDIKKSDLGDEVTSLINKIPGQASQEIMPIDLIIYNKLKQPKVKLSLDRAMSKAKDDAKKGATEKVKEKAKEIINNKENQEKAKKILKGLF